MVSLILVSGATPDASSPDTVVSSILSPGMTPEEKALAIYDYCRRHTFHWPAPREGDTHELGVVYDVNKLLNVYGYSYCFAIRALAEALYEAAGMEARSTGIGGHVVTEVYYNGAYHYLDHDQRGYARLSSGPIAQVSDYYYGGARQLILNAPSPPEPFFPATRRPRAPYEERHIFAGYLQNRQVHYHQHDKYRTTHPMQLTLRPGERIVRSWGGCGKWHRPPELVEEIRGNGYVDTAEGPRDHIAELYAGAPRLDSGDPLRYANGVSIFRPSLAEGSTDVQESAFYLQNLDTSAEGLRPLDTGGPAEAVFRLHLPYVIVGRPGAPGDAPRGACIVSVIVEPVRARGAGRLRVYLSRDGRQWKRADEVSVYGKGAFAFDVSRFVVGGYAYYVRLALRACCVTELGIDTAFQLNPTVLPAVRPGRNRMAVRFLPGPEVFEERVHYFRRQTHDRLCVAVENLVFKRGVYPMLRPPRAGTGGTVVYALRAPAGKLVYWAKAGGAFRSHPDVVDAPDESFRIAFAVDEPEKWTTVWEADRPPYLDHWCFEGNCDLRLPEPARVVYVRYELGRSKRAADGGGMVEARFSWGCAPPGSPKGGRNAAPVRMTHVWTENGQERRFEKTVGESDREYEFAVEAPRVTNVSLAMEIAGRGPATDGPHPLMAGGDADVGVAPVDPSSVAAMRASLVTLDREADAETAARIMHHHPHEWMQSTAPAALLALGGRSARRELKAAVGTREWAEGCYLELLATEGELFELTAYLRHPLAARRSAAAELLRLRHDAGAVTK
jgi:hypothetical protein